LAGQGPLFLGSPWRRQVFVVVNGGRSGRRGGSGGPSIIDLGRGQEEDQKVGELFHRGGHPLVRSTTPYHCYQPEVPCQSEQSASRRRGRGSWVAEGESVPTKSDTRGGDLACEPAASGTVRSVTLIRRLSLGFIGGLQPRLEIDGCLFTHVEPWRDPHTVEDLWYFDGPPDAPDKLARSFTAVPHRVLFLGHFHRWLLGTPAGLSPWRGEGPVRLDGGGRYLVVVHAVWLGRCALFDTDTSVLTPPGED
jgi:hypothetical protein